jgi:catechol 2,3-dioxygenase-like lactoylglutathione lyase family enzyme
MLSQFTPAATLATANRARARTFYEDTLGLKLEREDMSGVHYAAGAGRVFVYESQYAGTIQATGLTFEVPLGDFDTEVEQLRAKGVAFQTFDLEGVEWNDGVASMSEIRAVWFADPDGNIINVTGMS